MVSSQLRSDGFAVVAGVVDVRTCDVLASQLQAFGTIGVGSRALLLQPWCQKLAGNLRENPLLGGALASDSVAVQNGGNVP
jgi:hypothetical protein